MTNAWFLGARESVPQSEDEARSTVEPVRNEKSTAEATRGPEWNEFDSDESGELVGLSPRMLGAHVAESGDDHYVPSWAPRVGGAQNNLNSIIDNQISTSGTAAAREAAGQQGHGQIIREESLEPVIRTGAMFGNEYFTADNPVVQDGMGAYMTPPDQDNWASSLAQAQWNKASRTAAQDTAIRNMWSGLSTSG